MAINYNDKRFTKVTNEKNEALTENEKTYDNMIKQSDSFYNKQINASKNYVKQQQKNQQEQTDFTIDTIEQEKEKAKKDYTKEQSGAYVDWQKQSNQYGAEAEKKAAGGFTGSGYSESSQVSMYNTYQNRVATAREVFNNAILNYNNKITEARLKNNAALAEIAYNGLKDQLSLALQGFQYKNTLIIDKANKNREIEQHYYGRWQDVVTQINTENAQAEAKRQFNEQMAFNKQKEANDKKYREEQLAFQKQQAAEQMALERKKFSWQKSQAGSSSGGSSKKSSSKKSSSNSTIKKSNKKSTSNSKVSKNNIPKVSTYEEAASTMRKLGVASGDGGLMTKTEWARRKKSGSNRAETSYASYSDYLNAFVSWRTANPE